MKLIRLTGALAAVAMLAACSDDDNDGGDDAARSVNARFEVKVVNLTAAQPLSPLAIIAHDNAYRAFVDGTVATEGLEVLAEAGDNADLLAEARAAEAHLASVSGPGVPPLTTLATPVSVSFTTNDIENARLTVVTMLVNTNDAFTGINAANVGGMAVGQSRTFNAPAWDSGTEANTETAASIPGPAAGGTGFAAEKELRADNSQVPVRFHPGVVGNTNTEDGLPTSVLGEIHRFDNPVSRIIVTRVQ
ncbi:Uncharacterised protein [BD1-7 clade bacterium]|uniref:Spondin domain-containing protein n=1 Tax=BD1-7 clade bacterium TaxID=2029982 RepID=A0A5S9MRH8_9GAMM|nr:Uncharacterised protein [BD1-7 clade bacterium]CAA0084854.1 Uncharacterised protein [BD1-7 clade bacterium]